jgi:hypothetical protein
MKICTKCKTPKAEKEFNKRTRGTNGFRYLGVILGMVTLGICATTSTAKHKDSLGVVMQQTNPNVYLSGTLLDGSVFDSDGREFTSLRVHPLKTFALYDEDLLLCGNKAEDFQGKTSPVLITYERVAHQTVQGVACHELMGVDEVHESLHNLQH